MVNSNLILVRHCQGIGQQPDDPLTDVGIQQSQTLSDFLTEYSIDHITTSEYRRARQTIEPFSQAMNLPIHTDARLNERTLSAELLDNWQDVVRNSFDDHDLRAPGGESAREVLHRAWSALDEILNTNYTMPLVVTHGNLMALVLHSIDPAFGFEDWKSLSNPDVYILHRYAPSQFAFARVWTNS